MQVRISRCAFEVSEELEQTSTNRSTEINSQTGKIMKKKLLLTGINGFLGWNIYQIAKKNWELFGTVFTHPIEIPDAQIVKIDLTDFRALKHLFHETRPDGVIHTAAITDPNYCQKHPVESRKINVEASINIAGLCEDQGVPCIFTSSDLVFDGLNPPYDENAQVCPIGFYGEQKALAESGMQQRCDNVTVCRMPLMFGDPGPVANSFVQPMLKALTFGAELKLFTDEFRTPVGGSSAAQGILLALTLATGIIHLGGRDRVSRYEFGCMLAETMKFPKDKLITCLQSDVAMSAPRPPDVSLDSTKAYGLGFDPEVLSEALKLLHNPIE